jgi:hypothetical protein
MAVWPAADLTRLDQGGGDDTAAVGDQRRVGKRVLGELTERSRD